MNVLTPLFQNPPGKSTAFAGAAGGRDALFTSLALKISKAVSLRLMKHRLLNTPECDRLCFRFQSASGSSVGVRGNGVVGAAGKRPVERVLGAPLPLLTRQMSARLLLSELGLDPNQDPPP